VKAEIRRSVAQGILSEKSLQDPHLNRKKLSMVGMPVIPIATGNIK
jgi:hypothetical protein